MGDFVKGDPADRFRDDLVEGIHLHRAVDAFTDEHPAFLRARDRLVAPYRRWAGVLVDIFWDHALARAWDRHGTGELPQFAARVYEELGERRSELPSRMARFVDHMTGVDLLVAYGRRDGIDRALRGLSVRVRSENPFADAVRELDRIGPDLAGDLEEFLPDLWRHVGATSV